MAEKLINEESAVWNGGCFGFKISYILDIIKESYTLVSFENLQANYDELTKNSIDYEVVEKAKSIAYVPYDGYWSDLGTWNTLSDEMAIIKNDNVVQGEECEGNTIINETELPMVVLGVKNLIIAASADGILISDKERSAHIKPYLTNFSKRVRYEEKSWGTSKVVDSFETEEGLKNSVRHLTIFAGKAIAYTSNITASKTWTILSGDGFVLINDTVQRVKKSDIIKIEAGEIHSLKANQEMHIIEILNGDDIGEDEYQKFECEW